MWIIKEWINRCPRHANHQRTDFAVVFHRVCPRLPRLLLRGEKFSEREPELLWNTPIALFARLENRNYYYDSTNIVNITLLSPSSALTFTLVKMGVERRLFSCTLSCISRGIHDARLLSNPSFHYFTHCFELPDRNMHARTPSLTPSVSVSSSSVLHQYQYHHHQYSISISIVTRVLRFIRSTPSSIRINTGSVRVAGMRGRTPLSWISRPCRLHMSICFLLP